MTNVNITESDLYFKRVADKPELIEGYIEVKSMVEYRNKITEITQLLTYYNNNLRIIYDTLNRIKEVLITNVSPLGNAGDIKEQESLEGLIGTYTSEIDYIIRNLVHKEKRIMTGIHVDTYSIYDTHKNNATLVPNDTIDIESFIWKATLTDIDSGKYSFTYTITTEAPDTRLDIPNTRYGGSAMSTLTGSFTLEGFGPQRVTVSRNVQVDIELSTLELLDKVEVDTRLSYDFLIGSRDEIYNVRFPRISCNKWKINPESVVDDRDKFYVTTKERILRAITEVSAHIETAGTQISILNIKNEHLTSEYNTKLNILNMHIPNN